MTRKTVKLATGYVITIKKLPLDEDGQWDDNAPLKHALTFQVKGSMHWWINEVFETHADAERRLYAKQMSHLYNLMDDVWNAGITAGAFSSQEKMEDYLC